MRLRSSSLSVQYRASRPPEYLFCSTLPPQCARRWGRWALGARGRPSWPCCAVGIACCGAADESSPLRRLWVGLPAPRGQTDTGLAPFPVTRSVSPPAPHSSLCSARSRCTSWEGGRHVLGQTREGLEGGWREGGEKSGRDEGGLRKGRIGRGLSSFREENGGRVGWSMLRPAGSSQGRR